MKALEFLERLNSLHPSLQFTMEGEVDMKLPFPDVLVMRERKRFYVYPTNYRKPTFTGLYTRWDSFCSPGRKIALIRSLASRAKRICSPEYLSAEVVMLKSILQKNGYPVPILERVIGEILNPKPVVLTASLKPVYIRLPWMGSTSSSFKNRIAHATKRAVHWCETICIFTSRDAFSTCKKDALSAENISNLVYVFNCECGHCYVGKTSQRLGERVWQHVPNELVRCATNSPGGVPEARKVERPKRVAKRCVDVTNLEPASAAVASRTRSKARANAAPSITRCVTAAAEAACSVPKISKTDSAITRHLKTSHTCLKTVGASAMRYFTILARARNSWHLSILEATFINRRKPELCAQKDQVRSLFLF